MTIAKTSPRNVNCCIWTDSDYIVWEFSQELGRMVYRQLGLKTWHNIPPFATVPPEVYAFFNGRPNRQAEQALNDIAHLLDGKEWDTDTVVAIEEIVRSTGRTIKDVYSGTGG